MKKILILGGGFAGLWAALSAARMRKQWQQEDQIEISLVNKDCYHGLRPRFYEEDLESTRIEIEPFLSAASVQFIKGEVEEISHQKQQVSLKDGSLMQYDRLLLATGSRLHTPPVPGLKEHSFNVDTYDAAVQARKHLEMLKDKPSNGRYTIVVVGCGHVGIEVATDFMDRLKKAVPSNETPRVIVVDSNKIASVLKTPEVIQEVTSAFESMGIKTRENTTVEQIAKDHIILSSGERIETQTVVWAAGMRANGLTKLFPVPHDSFGRLPVDEFLRIKGISNCYAAGDVAGARVDTEHFSLLSCQHAMPMGRFSGYNLVADLLNKALIPYQQPMFVSIMDLGSYGAYYALGWERKMMETGKRAKVIKEFINHNRIYPPSLENGLDTLFEYAEPVFKPINFDKILEGIE